MSISSTTHWIGWFENIFVWKLTLQPANLVYFGLDSNYFEVSIRFQLYISLFILYNSFVLLYFYFYFYYASHFVSYAGCIQCYLVFRFACMFTCLIRFILRHCRISIFQNTRTNSFVLSLALLQHELIYGYFYHFRFILISPVLFEAI